MDYSVNRGYGNNGAHLSKIIYGGSRMRTGVQRAMKKKKPSGMPGVSKRKYRGK